MRCFRSSHPRVLLVAGFLSAAAFFQLNHASPAAARPGGQVDTIIVEIPEPPQPPAVRGVTAPHAPT
jgi:hypothetical protein